MFGQKSFSESDQSSSKAAKHEQTFVLVKIKLKLTHKKQELSKWHWFFTWRQKLGETLQLPDFWIDCWHPGVLVLDAWTQNAKLWNGILLTSATGFRVTLQKCSNKIYCKYKYIQSLWDYYLILREYFQAYESQTYSHPAPPRLLFWLDLHCKCKIVYFGNLGWNRVLRPDLRLQENVRCGLPPPPGPELLVTPPSLCSARHRMMLCWNKNKYLLLLFFGFRYHSRSLLQQSFYLVFRESNSFVLKLWIFSHLVSLLSTKWQKSLNF